MKYFKKLMISVLMAVVFSTAMISTPFVPQVTAKAAAVALTKSSVTIYLGDTYSLRITGSSKTVKWSSSNKKIAKVSSGGVVSGVAKGTVTITATVNSKKYTCKVQVKSQSISKSSLRMVKADKKTLSIRGATGKVTWTSSNTAVAVVNSKGEVTAAGVGTAKITGKYKNKSYLCSVTVFSGLIHTDNTNLSISEDTTVKVTVEDLQKNENLQYEIKDTSVADVELGDWSDNTIPVKITPLKKGSTTITITTDCKSENLVLNVTVTDANSSTGSSSNTNELTAKEVYSLCSTSCVQINTDSAIGTGFFIDDYTVVTNYHVIDGATSIKVQLLNGESYDVTSVLGYSEDLDIAVLKVPVTETPLAVNSHGVTTGETVYTIGSSQGLTDTFTDGIVTNTSRTIYNIDCIQTNAAITNGNSGGPLLNAYGEVMGITSMGYVEGQNINFAINISQYSKVSLANPISASDFYKLSSSTDSSSSSDDADTTYEDETASESAATAQTITSGSYVEGTVTDAYDIDYYKFTLTSSTEVSLAAISDTTSDLGQILVGIVDSTSDENVVAAGSVEVDGDLTYIGLDETLSAGTYYVIVLSDDDYTSDGIPYYFGIYYN